MGNHSFSWYGAKVGIDCIDGCGQASQGHGVHAFNDLLKTVNYAAASSGAAIFLR